MKSVIEKAEVWGGVNSPRGGVVDKLHEQALPSGNLQEYGCCWILLPILCVKKAAFKGETAQPPPTLQR